MIDKHINTCEFLNICQTDCSGTLEDTEVCHCYELYRQLERKEQECEELKSVRDMWMSKCEQEMKTSEFFQDVLAEVKADNEELKEEIKHYKQIAQYHGNLSVKYTNKSAKLKQTLTEIKEIAEKVYNDCDNCYRDMDTNYDVDCIDCTLGGEAKLAEQILQKISEVKND